MGSAGRSFPLALVALLVQRSLGQAAAASPLELGQLRSEGGPLTDAFSGGAEKVLAKMRAHPEDARLQTEGCKRFVLLSGMESAKALGAGELSPLLTRDNVNTLADAIIRHTGDRELVYSCFSAIVSFGATFSRPITVHLNNGTRIPEALEKVLRHYALDRQVQADFLMMVAGFASYVACDAQPPYVRAGCLDRLWDALDNFPSPQDSDVQMSAWMGFADHSSCPASAEYISNYGGKSAGASRVAEALRQAIGNHFCADMMHGGDIYSLQYEIMATANGLLKHANETNGVREAMTAAGYHTAVLDSMRDMPDHRNTNDRACYAIHLLAEGSPSMRRQVIESGGLELIAAAMERFKSRDHRVVVIVPVIPSCTIALDTLARDDPAAQDRLLSLGVLDTLATADPAVIRDEVFDLQVPDMRALLSARAGAAGA